MTTTTTAAATHHYAVLFAGIAVVASNTSEATWRDHCGVYRMVGTERGEMVSPWFLDDAAGRAQANDYARCTALRDGVHWLCR